MDLLLGSQDRVFGGRSLPDSDVPAIPEQPVV
jgi:hypothetical protein